MTKTFLEYLNEAPRNRYSKPKNSFPQSKKTYATSIKAKLAAEKLIAKIEKDYKDDYSSKVVGGGTYAVAQMVKSKKFIVSWIVGNNVTDRNNAGLEISGKFLDAGHSSTPEDLMDEFEEQGSEIWEMGDKFVVKWV